jgi:hypothetical protein
MSARRTLAAVWDFVVGDDWRLALAAAVAIGLTAIVCALGPSAWWLAPLVALLALRWSLRHATPSTLVTQRATSVGDHRRRLGRAGGAAARRRRVRR